MTLLKTIVRTGGRIAGDLIAGLYFGLTTLGDKAQADFEENRASLNGPTSSPPPPSEVVPQPPLWDVTRPSQATIDRYRQQGEVRREAHWKDLEKHPHKMMKEMERRNRQLEKILKK